MKRYTICGNVAGVFLLESFDPDSNNISVHDVIKLASKRRLVDESEIICYDNLSGSDMRALGRRISQALDKNQLIISRKI